MKKGISDKGLRRVSGALRAQQGADLERSLYSVLEPLMLNIADDLDLDQTSQLEEAYDEFVRKVMSIANTGF